MIRTEMSSLMVDLIKTVFNVLFDVIKLSKKE